MDSITLKYPVISIYGERLVDAGTIITKESIDSFIPENNTKYKYLNFLKYKEIKNDIIKNINLYPYTDIFTDTDKKNSVLTLMEIVNLPLPVIESVYWFKSNDYYTYRHFLMVLTLTTLLSMEIINEQSLLEKSITAGSTHDIGKICIPDSILKKTVPLTKTEKNDLKQHTVAGYILLTYYYNNTCHHIATAARDHHERRDGSGYPFKSKEISELSDIIVVSDIFDALISSRPYRPTPYDIRTALEEITDLAVKKKLNWSIVQALVNILRNSDSHYSECEVSLEKRGIPPEDNLYGIYSKK